MSVLDTTPPATASRPPLWCFAGGGAPALAMLPIARSLPADQSVHGLQAHGYEGRAVPDFSVRGVARRFERRILATTPTGPYPLVGHSFGGLVALEVAHRLTARGASVPFVMMLDSVLPPALGHSEGLATTDGPPPAPEAPTLSAAWVRQRLRRRAQMAAAGLVPLPRGVRDEVFWERSMRMAARHRPRRWTGRVVLVLSEHNTDDVEAWAPVTSGEIVVHRVRGGHSAIMRPPFHKPVVEILAAELDRARAER
ncbi:thioesterase domain-containing protein [Actinomycetospora flava]|uniref:Thioesterase domain-containing protein n=1 Tax=Actinomycetospora flava TaxID=3129232 RepID=A0ABU8MB97_9PSEU